MRSFSLTIMAKPGLYKTLVVLASAFCCFLFWVGNSSAAPIKLKNSDELEILRGGVTDTIINIGNVRFNQGDAHLSCDSSIWIVGKQLLMWGNVNYREGSRSLFSDTLIYDLVDSIMYATGHVVLKEDQSDILGDSLKYVVADSTLYVTGDSVIITSVTDSMWAVGKEAFIDRASGRLELLTDARVVFGYPDTTVTRSLSALYIRYEYDSAIAVAQEDVVLLEGDSKATGACAIIERNSARVRLYEGATLDWLGNFVSGEFISIRSFLGKPERIDVYGDGVALFTEVDTVSESEVGMLDDSLSISDSLLLADGQRLDSAIADSETIALVDSVYPVDTAYSVDTADYVESDEMDTLSSDSSLLTLLPDTTINSTGFEIPGKRITSKITGAHLAFMFVDGLLHRADAFGQAYSYYTPTPLPGESKITNTASGDSIQLYVADNQLSAVKAFGSVVGDYIEDRSAKRGPASTSKAATVDTIKYNGERVSFNLQDSIITLTGFAGVIQGPMSLSADSILYSTAERLVKAYALELEDTPVDSVVANEPYTDAANSDSVDSTSVDTLNEDFEAFAIDDPYLGTVTLKDGSQDVDGEYIEFSMVTRKGLIIQSNSEYEGAYYTGSELYRVEDDVFLVDGGTYTTCDYESPHFHFWSKHMKMIRGNKMIAKPVVFFIEKIPIFALPFYVFPLEQGRRSGILNFRFGNFNQGGRFLANLGYYWAASEYWDIQSWMDYYETSGPSFSTQLRYNKRYSFSGNFGASVAYTSNFDRSTFQETKSKRWRINFNHRQTISPTFSLNASGNFLSDSRYFTDFTDNLNDRLNRTLRSQVNFSKRLGRSSLSGSYVFDENLDGDKRKTETFPNLSFSMPAVQIFGSAAPGEDKKWYHSIRMGYSSTLRHTSEGRDDDSTTVALADTTVTIDTVLTNILDSTVSPPDSIGVDTTIDTSSSISVVALDSTFFRTERSITTYTHGTSVGPNFTILKYFPVSFALRYNETWFKVNETNQSFDAGINTDRFFRTYTASASAGISTHLYGTVKPNLFGLRGIRHEMNPSASYSYTPNIRFDQETLEAARFVGARSTTNRSQSINFGLRNVFEVKVGSEESSKKITLLTMNSSLSYNPEAIDRRWSSMNTSFQSSFIRRVTMSGSMVHSFYADGGLQRFQVNTSFSTGGNFGEFRSFGPELNGLSTGNTVPSGGGGSLLGSPAKSRTWSFRASHTYSQIKGSPLKRNFMTFSAQLQLTPNMSVSYNQSYDIFNKSTVNRHLRIYRILHRWEGVFDWTPSGSNSGFSFRINVIDLPDIKFEKSLTSSLGRQLIQN